MHKLNQEYKKFLDVPKGFTLFMTSTSSKLHREGFEDWLVKINLDLNLETFQTTICKPFIERISNYIFFLKKFFGRVAWVEIFKYEVFCYLIFSWMRRDFFASDTITFFFYENDNSKFGYQTNFYYFLDSLSINFLFL